MQEKKSTLSKVHKTKNIKKQKNPDNAHWIKSQAKLVKILEAAGMTPEKHKIMLTCDKDR